MNDPMELSFQVIDGEPRWGVVGVTNRGRFLVLLFTERNAKVRVVTAFDATEREIADYFKTKAGY